MSFKINGTVVIDNSRNVCASCITADSVEATNQMVIPSGTTACRPTGSTGSLYFDTDQGALVAYTGSDWARQGGSATAKCLTPVTDYIGPLFVCYCSTTTNTTVDYQCIQCSSCFFVDGTTCTVGLFTPLCNINCCPGVRLWTFDPTTCSVSCFQCGDLCAPYNGNKPRQLTYGGAYCLLTDYYSSKNCTFLFNGSLYTLPGGACH